MTANHSVEQSQIRLRPADKVIAAFLALLLFGIYLLTFDGTLHSTDGLSMFAVAENIVKHGQFDTAQLENWESATLGIDNRPYTVFPVGPPLFILPFFGLALAFPGLGLTQTSMILMPLASGLNAIYVYLIARRLGYSVKVGWIMVILAGFATMTWPRTRDLVADPLILLSFTSTFYYALAYRQEKKVSQATLMGIALGLTILHKLVNTVTVPLFLWYLTVPSFNIFPLKKLDWRAGFAAVPPIFLALLIIGFYNAIRFGNPLDSGFRGHLTFSTPVWIGVTGLLISPYKSLFLYVPLFAVIPFIIRRTWRVQPREMLLILALLVSHLLIFGAWHDWGGGRNWGPRYLAPLNALLTLLLLPLLGDLFQRRRWAVGVLFGTICLLSIGMQVLGISARDYAFLDARDYWTRPPNLSYLGELRWSQPDQWPIWGHWLRFDIRQIPVIWRWHWVEQSHFDAISLIAAVVVIGLGLGGTILAVKTRLSRRWAWAGWAAALGCAAVILGRSYDDPRSIDPSGGAAKLWPAYSALVDQLPALVKPGEAIIFTDRRFEFYLLDLDKSAARRYIIAKPDQPRILETIPHLLEQDAPLRVWLVTDDLDNRQVAYATELWLNQRATPIEHYRFGDSVQLTAYNTAGTVPWTAIPPEPQLAGLVNPDRYTFNGIAALLGWDWPELNGCCPPRLKPGEPYDFELYWIYHGKAVEDRFFVRLLDETQQPVVEVFTHPRPDQRLIPGQLLIEDAVLTIPPTLPPGVYQLQIGFTIPVVEAGELVFDLPGEMTAIEIGPGRE